MPDALSKTVPIWSAVMNKSLFPEKPASHHVQFPPRLLGASEKSQIQSRIDGFVAAFKGLGLDLEALKRRMGKPVRLEWATREYPLPECTNDMEYHLIVLCSASKRVRGAEMSEGGYIQGAGDDSEGWAYGLTPDIFWKEKDILLSTGEESLPGLIEGLLQKQRQAVSTEQATVISPTKNVFIGKSESLNDPAISFDLIIDCHGDPDSSQGTRLNLGCGTGKLGSRNLRKVLDRVEEFIPNHLNKDSSQSLLVACDTGKDLSVGTALMILCSFFNDDGKLSFTSKSPI
ncbi:conserved hypothetical protein [Uncinocarpus reesii 1704]|uniref:Initiator tRNA phosphoribosyl transferase n=1 Tax=Uncinocarpus reesii (strain UAMH 1704) TaxID=336963 RepID=C4JNT1_UNCRE|nr:uncharacterized protein UREG_04401 [Uncinocarpus reesii 1704]EEP79555.1 conserved hypothetical protein [Uncinocarpus reesii 1704]